MLKYHIQTIEVGSGGTPVISFTNIPQVYDDLYLVLSLRGSLNNPQIGHLIRFNNDSGANYSSRRLVGSGSSASSASESGSTTIYGGQAPALTQTSNTFGNTSIYIPNYTGSTAKSVSLDVTRETNGAAIFMGLIAGLWSGTAAINSVDILCEVDNWVQYSSASLYGIKRGANGKTEVATGGTVTTSGGYTIHTFTSSSTFVANRNLTVETLVIAGGGGGGGQSGGGGGAGGYRSSVAGESSGGNTSAEPPLTLSAGTSYLVTVGGGGTAGTPSVKAGKGSNSQFSNVVSEGGGLGAGSNGSWYAGESGGSGGGGSYGATAAGSGTSNQGTNGGIGIFISDPQVLNGGGGGGASAAGQAGQNAANSGGNGGAGITSSITGTAVARGGGGGGSRSAAGTSSGGAGGTGGGGTGGFTANSPNSGTPPTAGTANTGGGGGGANWGSGQSGAAGGSGVVIIRYLTPA